METGEVTQMRMTKPMTFRRAFAAAAGLAAAFGAAMAHQPTGYEPMAPFAPFAGHTVRGEGTGPDGRPVVDIQKWEFILNGRAFQATHRLENGDYGGRTIFFYDEAAKKYIFHYFTTAGFHTTGEATPVKGGFSTVEQVNGHASVAEVRSLILVDGDGFKLETEHVDKEGKATAGDGFIYTVIEDPGPLFSDKEGHHQ